MHKKTIYIECSASFLYGSHTGIPNVVRAIVREAFNLAASSDLKVVPIVFNGVSFLAIPQELLLEKRQNRAQKKETKFIELVKKAENILPGSAGVFIKLFIRRIGHVVLSYKKTRLFEKVHMKKGDYLFCSDIPWYTPFDKQISALKKNGVIITALVYDLIPLRYPEYTTAHVSKLIKKFFLSIFKNASALICISHTVEEDVKKFLVENNIPLPQILTTVYCGRATQEINKSDPVVREHVREIVSLPGRMYTIVSSIEPRKNHLYALEAFTKLWNQGSDSKLIVVGKVGWKCDHIINALEKHSMFGKKLFVINDASDYERDHLYKSSDGVLSMSIVEGFGLPIVEALEKGKPIFLSDIPVHREIAREYGIFVDLNNSNSLVKAICDYEVHGLPQNIPPLTSFKWQTWSESVGQILNYILTAK